MNDRRSLLIVLGALAFSPRDAFAQERRPVVIGWLSTTTRDASEPARRNFRVELAALGWKEGSSYVVEERYADRYADRLQSLAAEIAAKKPVVIVAMFVPSAKAAATASPNTPIVVVGGDAVASGLVASYARPEGMVTGISDVPTEISSKYLELLVAAMPKLKRVGFLLDSSATGFSLHKENARRAALHYAVEARMAEVARPEEIEPALAQLAKSEIQALVVMPSPGLFGAKRQHTLDYARSQQWPVISVSTWADHGALIGYYASSSANYRRAAHYVNRILRGAKPADLPIERPMTFDLVINLKAAKALGLTMPADIMVRATRVIE